jgi:hypothetical protein
MGFERSSRFPVIFILRLKSLILLLGREEEEERLQTVSVGGNAEGWRPRRLQGDRRQPKSQPNIKVEQSFEIVLNFLENSRFLMDLMGMSEI